MNCEQYQRILDEGTLSEQPPSLLTAFHAHRAQCPDCDQLYQLDQSWQQALRDDVSGHGLDSASFAQRVMAAVQKQAVDKPVVEHEPVALNFRRHWLPVSLAAAIALGLLSGLWYQLAQKPPSTSPPHTMTQQPAHAQGSGAAMVSLVRSVQGQWVTQPLALLDGMPEHRLQVDWQTMLKRVPSLLPDPARLTHPTDTPTQDKEQLHGNLPPRKSPQLG